MEEKTKKCGRPSKRKTAKNCSGSCADGCNKAETADTKIAAEPAPAESAQTEDALIEKLIKDNVLTPERLVKALNKLTGANIDFDAVDDEDEDNALEFEQDTDTAITHGVYEGGAAVSRVIDIEGVGQLVALPLPGSGHDDEEGATSTAYFWVNGGRVTVPAAIAEDLEAPAAALGLELNTIGPDSGEDDCLDEDEDEDDEAIKAVIRKFFTSPDKCAWGIVPKIRVYRF